MLRAPFVLTAGRLARTIGAVSVAAVLLVAASAMANADDNWGTPYDVPLHQETPITDDDFGEHGDCPGVPSSMDGWHFVTPKRTVFVALTVTFVPGGTQTITEFGPPSDKHAYVASAIGAELVHASATVQTKEGFDEIDFFNLSHTCPGDSKPTKPPTETPSETPSESPTKPTETPSESPTKPTETPSESPTKQTETPTDKPSETPSETPTESPSKMPDEEETTPEGEETTPAGEALPKTGSNLPVVPLTLLAFLLIAAGTGALMRIGVVPMPYRRRH